MLETLRAKVKHLFSRRAVDPADRAAAQQAADELRAAKSRGHDPTLIAPKDDWR